MARAEFRAGTKLAEVEKTISQETIDRWAEVSGDHNPLHVDPEFAKNTRFGGTIAHGHLSLGYLSELLARSFGKSAMEGGKLLEIRFTAPIRPGDTVTACGEVTDVDEGPDARRVSCDVRVQNQKGESCVVGKAEVPLLRETSRE